ncbi:MAG: hypothetical protein JJ895_08935 [Balneolaceae bacterium]|nr:hypothetical protein [Balneolaceae bacterium]
MKYFHYLPLLCLLILSCDINSSNNQVVDELKDAQQVWLNADLSNYEYTYQAVCFCAFTDQMIVVIQDDTVSQVLDVETREPYTLNQGDEEIQILESYPDLFHTISQFYDRWIVEIPVSYKAKFEWDKKSGMPIKMNIDRIENAVDDEISYNFSGLVVN